MAFRKSTDVREDIARFMGMTEVRRRLIAEAPDTLPVAEFGVNRLAKALHPGYLRAEVVAKAPAGTDCCRITLRSLRADGRFPYFRAGQFVALSAKVGESFLTRPYSIASSPREALAGTLEVIVQRSGIFSTWLIDEAQPGTQLVVGEPSGDFHHDSLRDAPHVVAVAGGSGVTPFLSMAKAICEGSEDFRLTLIAGARTRAKLCFDPEAFHDERVRVVPVLSHEEVPGFRHGFITADVLREFVDEDTSVFLCGPDALYSFARGELAKLGVEPARIRQERNAVGNRAVEEPATFSLTVRIRDAVRTIPASTAETLVTAMERAGIAAPVRCKNGSCGFCHSRVIAGEYFVAPENDFRRAADRKFGYIHPCCTYPLSDMEIDVPIFEPEE
ncbi:MAG: 2Fe-2S iron-sulfur cluster binding domain-containing protein [Eggerthellaceae bacterium]|nr:2Fe-2S iron-sulfur cluster binding domain-containing protein [Eggerthellaceae bacterium]